MGWAAGSDATGLVAAGTVGGSPSGAADSPADAWHWKRTVTAEAGGGFPVSDGGAAFTSTGPGAGPGSGGGPGATFTGTVLGFGAAWPGVGRVGKVKVRTTTHLRFRSPFPPARTHKVEGRQGTG